MWLFITRIVAVPIVGVWKETTKLASYASDLSDRIEYFDIGDWGTKELELIVTKSDEALHTDTSTEIIKLLIDYFGCNVGIFKSLLKNFNKQCMVFETQDKMTVLNEKEKAKLLVVESALIVAKKSGNIELSEYLGSIENYIK